MSNTSTKVFADMSAKYQEAYQDFCEAKGTFLTEYVFRYPVNNDSLEAGYLKDRICRSVDANDAKFRVIFPRHISEMGANGEEFCIREMQKLCNLFTACVKKVQERAESLKEDAPKDKFLELISISDVQAFTFEATHLADCTLRLCHLAIKRKKSLLDAIFNTADTTENMDRIMSRVEDFKKYIQAVDDFTDEDEITDNLPDAVFKELGILCDVYSLLSLLVVLERSGEPVQTPAKPPINLEEIKSALSFPFQATSFWIASKSTQLFRPKDDPLLTDVLEELYDIRTNPDNFTGMHVNHVTSGEEHFFIQGATYRGEEETDGQMISAFDEIRQGPFQTREEAEEALKNIEAGFTDERDFATIIDIPTDEFFAVISNATGKMRIPCMPAYELDAYAMLYALAKPASFMAYCEENAEEKEGGAE